MAKKDDFNKPKKISLKMLYENKLVFSKVKAMMEKGCSYKDIIKFLNVQGFLISKGSLTNLKHKLEEAQQTGIPLDQLIDKRKKTNINQTNAKGYIPTDTPATSQQQLTQSMKVDKNLSFKINPTKKYWSDNQVLDEIIDKGIKALDNVDIIDLPYLMKAIELKEKYFNKDTKGLTIDAIKQYEILIEAQMVAVKEVVAKYVPEDQQDNAYLEIKQQAQQAIDDLTISPEGKSLLSALQQAGLKI